MSNSAADEPIDLSSLDIDLAQSFRPAWTREDSRPNYEKFIGKYDSETSDGRRGDRPGRDRFGKNSGGRSGGKSGGKPGGNFGERKFGERKFGERKPFRRDHDKDKPRDGERRENSSQNYSQNPQNRPHDRGDRNDRRGDRHRRDGRGSERFNQPRRVVLTGWEISAEPEPHALEILAKQIRSTMRTYPMFDLARLLLDNPQRYIVRVRRANDSAIPLFFTKSDSTLWLDENAAIMHSCSVEKDKLYRSEIIEVEAPKGNFPMVATCDGELICPPNYHDYGKKLQELHSRRYVRMPFDAFKRRIEFLSDEESINRWRETQTKREVFFPVDSPEERFESHDALVAHFRRNHAPQLVERVEKKISGIAPAASAYDVREAVKSSISYLVRFPLPFAQSVSQKLAKLDIQVFRNKEIVYLGATRPHSADVSQMGAPVQKIFSTLAAHPKAPRGEQMEAIYAAREATTEDDKKAVIADLFWLLSSGFIVDYVGRNLVVTPQRTMSAPEPTREPSEPIDMPEVVDTPETVEIPDTPDSSDPLEERDTTLEPLELNKVTSTPSFQSDVLPTLPEDIEEKL